MTLTRDEKKQLGAAAGFVAADDASLRLWRWLAPCVPRSEGDLYTAALRRLREVIRHALEAEGCSGSEAVWLTRAMLAEEGQTPDALAERLASRLRLTPERAAACLERILPALAQTPCIAEPVRTALGHYAAAQAFLEDLSAHVGRGTLPPQLGSPIPAPVLAAVSRIVYRHISVAEDPRYAVALIRQLLYDRGSLRRDLERHFSRGGSGAVFWNMGAFFAGFVQETDVQELLLHTELMDLVRAFVITEYRTAQAGKQADAFHTNALCALVLMLLGAHALRPSQKVEICLSDSMELRGIDVSELSQRPDYIRALFSLGLEEFLPDGLWEKNALPALRDQLAFPTLILSGSDWAVLAVLAVMAVYNAIREPLLVGPVLMLAALLVIGYLGFRGGGAMAWSFFVRFLRRHVWFQILLALLMVYLFVRFELPDMLKRFGAGF